MQWCNIVKETMAKCRPCCLCVCMCVTDRCGGCLRRAAAAAASAAGGGCSEGWGSSCRSAPPPPSSDSSPAESREAWLQYNALLWLFMTYYTIILLRTMLWHFWMFSYTYWPVLFVLSLTLNSYLERAAGVYAIVVS